MIRTDFDVSDEDHSKVVKAHDKVLHKFVVDKFLHEFCAFYLATGYRMDAIWSGDLDSLLYGASDGLVISDLISELNHDKLKEILKKEYGFIITNETPLEIQDIKKQDQRWFADPFLMELKVFALGELDSH